MSLPKTSWQELYNLGSWTDLRVFDRLNAQRGRTMQTWDDLALNASFDDSFGWYCYNDFKGPAKGSEPLLKTTHTFKVVWEHKNDTDEPYHTTFTETWENSTRVDASITQKAFIALGRPATASGFFGTDFSFSFTARTPYDVPPQYKEKKQTYAAGWVIVVPPGERRRLVRKTETTRGTQEFRLDYGFTDDSVIGTSGKPYNGRTYWAYEPNHYLDNPTGTVVLTGQLTDIKCTFAFESVGDDETVTELPIELPTKSTVQFSSSETGVEQEVTRVHAHSVPDPEVTKALV